MQCKKQHTYSKSGMTFRSIASDSETSNSVCQAVLVGSAKALNSANAVGDVILGINSQFLVDGLSKNS